MQNTTIARWRANRTVVAYIVLAAGVIALGFSGIFVSVANAPGAVTGFYRMLIAQAIFVLPFMRRGRRRGRRRRGKQQHQPQSGSPRREIAIAAFAGLLFAGDLLFWNTGILLSGPTNPTLMGNTAPIWVALGAMLFFRERPPGMFWAGLAVAMAGALLVLGLDALQAFELGLGTFLGMLAGMFYGGYFLVMQRSRQQLDAITSFWWAGASAMLVLLLAALLLDQPLLGYPLITWLCFLGLGLIVQVFGQFSFSFALGYLPASLVSPAGLAQPVLTAILAAVLLNETLSLGEIIGGLTVLAGIFIVQRSRMAGRVMSVGDAGSTTGERPA